MEKVFQIHLAGMHFTIEEQAYLKLKNYLDNLHAHFRNNSEIVQDIEGRMSELFVQKLGTNRNTLFMDDVEEVVKTLGNINQMDEHGEIHAEPKVENQTVNLAHRKLRRSPTDQSLGGVCSGVASFFDVDPVLVRVIFVIMLIVYGSGILLYLILWIVVPEAKGEEAEYMRLQRLNKTKRLFRDADSRVVGGVSAGLSLYFGIDRTWIRLAFIASFFLFGTGFWLYILLWIIVPKAISASDKLLMRGEIVDIKNIERELTQNQGPNKMNSFAQHGSNVLGKIIKGILKIFGGIFALVLFVIVVAISIAMVAVFFNLGQTHFINEIIQFTVKDSSIIYAAKAGVLLSILTPMVGLLLIVVKALFKVKFIDKNWALTLGGMFLVGVICLAYAGISFGTSVSHKESTVNLEKTFVNDTLILEGVEMPLGSEDNINIEFDAEMTFRDKGLMMGKDSFYLEIDEVKLKQGKSDSIVLKIVSRSNGRNKEDANSKLEMIVYNPKIIGNRIVLPAYFTLGKDKQFSWQEVDVTLWVPAGKVIKINPEVKDILDDNNLDEADGDYYKFENNELKCLDCAGDLSEDEDDNGDENGDKIDLSINKDGIKISTKINSTEEENGKITKTEKVITKDGIEITVEEDSPGKHKVTKTIERKK